MTNEQQKAKELAKLLTAFADGKRIEYQTENLEWFGTTSLMYIADSVIDNKRQIRIKPETKRVPLTMQDLIDRELSGKTMRVKHGIACRLIQDFNDELVFLFDDEFSYEQLTSLEWIDDTPCYKEVDDE